MLKSVAILNVVLLANLCSADEPQAPVVSWNFESAENLDFHGQAEVQSVRLTSPVYPLFPGNNSALELSAPSWVQIADPGQASQFDFTNDDEVTFEAWVRIDRAYENICLVGKGRTKSGGPHSIDQNWAFRLRNNGHSSGVNFLFRSADTESEKGNWHRWTSDLGISAGAKWHHVALRYRFGDPSSIKAFVNGKPSDGKWDMGGPTSNAPVVNDQAIWIGSTMGGNVGNSLTGAIDEIRIHRRLLSDDELKARYAFTPPDTTPKSIPADQVLVQMIPAASSQQFDPEVAPPLLEWHQPDLAFHAMPQLYDDWGIRKDPGATVLMRAWSRVTFPAGQYQLLIRARGLSRLVIDDREVASLGPMKKKGGAHNHVIPLPETPLPQMRPHAMNEQEQVVTWVSTGKPQKWLFETVVGGPQRRPEFGETCVAVASNAEMFNIVSATNQFPLTDQGWLAFRESHRSFMDDLNNRNRAEANRKQEPFWTARHQLARRRFLTQDSIKTIDDTIDVAVRKYNHRAQSNLNSRDSGGVFQEVIQPMLQTACGRCHGQKQNGGLSILDREHLLAGGESGQPAIVPGKPEDSYLLELISADVDDYRMPPKGDGLTSSQVATVREWIQQGAPMPAAKADQISVPPPIDDLTFLRRVFIDTVGVIPNLEEIRWFEALPAESRRKTVVDRLVQDDRWADNWVGYWQDVLAENPNLLKPTLNNTGPFRFWIHEALRDNKSLDRFATELILMRGSTWSGGTAGFAVASQNDSPMAAKAHVVSSAFLGIDMKCARCHDAPYHEHTQADLFQMAAMLKRQPIQLPESSTVPAAFFAKQESTPLIEATLKTGDVVSPEFPFQRLLTGEEDPDVMQSQDLRMKLALSVTGSRRFAEVMANRIWHRLMGGGLVEPVDDWEANPASHPELLKLLADLLIAEDYDSRQLVKHILLSEAYQRQAVNRTPDDPRLFAGPYRRRMSAEQIVDSAFVAAGRTMRTGRLTMDLEGLLAGDKFLNFGYPARSWEMTTLANERDRPSLAFPKAQPIVDVLAAFGWRDSRPEPITERISAPNVIQPGVLANGSLGILLTRISEDSTLVNLLQETTDVEDLTEALYLRFLTRRPTADEVADFRQLLESGFAERIIPVAERTIHSPPKRHRYVSWSNHLHTDANLIKMEMQEEVRQGPVPSNRFVPEWRERAEDALWALLNAPEMIIVP